MKQIDKVVKGIAEPKDINVLWLDTNDPKSPTLKAYADGKWEAVSGGGGGSTEGAVSYSEPQELTEEQQMQARKNQGLYYNDVGPGEKTVSRVEAHYIEDDHDPDYYYFEGTAFYRVSSDTPSQEDIISIVTENVWYLTEQTTLAENMTFVSWNQMSLPSTDNYIGYPTSEGFSSSNMFIVVFDGTQVEDGRTYNTGIFIPCEWDSGSHYITKSLTYEGDVVIYHKVPDEYLKTDFVSYNQQSLEEAQKKQARLNQGLYYPELRTNGYQPELWDGDTTGLETISGYFGEDEITLYKVSDDFFDVSLSLANNSGYYAQWHGYTEVLNMTFEEITENRDSGSLIIGRGKESDTYYYIAFADHYVSFDGFNGAHGLYFSKASSVEYVEGVHIMPYIGSDNRIPVECILPAVEIQRNKVTKITGGNTDEQYPSAKAVYDIVGNVETLLAAL